MNIKKLLIGFLILLTGWGVTALVFLTEPEVRTLPVFQTLLDTAQVEGVLLIYARKQAQYYTNDYARAKQGQLPASTFKIPHSIIALETGVVPDTSTLFRWDGRPRFLKVWEQDMTFREAFHRSCVPCYQEVARAVGLKRMRAQLGRLDYGTMQVDSLNLDRFWLAGRSQISPMEQIDFLRRLYRAELPIGERTNALIRKMIVMETEKGYRLSGKTGWSIRGEENNGWFVGYLETAGETYFFATNISPLPGFPMARFAALRKELTYQALTHLGVHALKELKP